MVRGTSMEGGRATGDFNICDAEAAFGRPSLTAHPGLSSVSAAVEDLWMAFDPQRACGSGRIESELIPPRQFITLTMQFAMMSPAQWDRELVTYSSAESSVCAKRK